MKFNDRDEIMALTPLWHGERFPDGRPRVPDKYLEAMQGMTLEELWKPIFTQGYITQFEGICIRFTMMAESSSAEPLPQPTCRHGPNLFDVAMATGAAEGRKGTFNQWVVDSLVGGDVAVIDMYDKIYKGTFLGGNLTTADKKAHGERRSCHLGRHSGRRADEKSRGRSGLLPRY